MRLAGKVAVITGAGSGIGREAALLFARHPTGFLPTEDQGYCLVVARLPPGASQPRVRETAARIDAVLKDVRGVKGWVTSGGWSALDATT